MRARGEVVSAVAKRYRSSDRSTKGRILDELPLKISARIRSGASSEAASTPFISAMKRAGPQR
jgi:hypothetical protein